MAPSKYFKTIVLALFVMAALNIRPLFAINMLGPQIGLTSSGAYWPSLCYNEYSNQYLALWVDVPDGWQLKARRIDAQIGTLLGPEFYISSAPLSFNAVTGSAAYNSVNHEWFAVYKADLGGGNLEDVIGQRIASDGSFVGGYIPLVSKSNYQNEQAVAHDPVNNRYLVVWMEVVGGDRDVKGRFFDQAGAPIGSEFQIRDSSSYNGYEPKVCYNPYYDEFMVIWKDYRNYIGSGQDNAYGDIYGQRINANTMAKIGVNIPIYWGGSPYVTNGQDSPGGLVCNPNDGRYFIGMTTLTAAYGWTVRALVVNYDGSWQSGLINVTHPVFGTCQGVAFSDSDDTYVISYQANDGSFSCRRYSASGGAIGGEEIIMPPMSSEGGDLAVRGSTGEFLQLGYSSSNHALKAQRFGFSPDTFAPGAVNPLRAYKQSPTSVLLTWANPADVDFSGTMIRYRTDTYPTSITDGTLVCNRGTAPGLSDSFVQTVSAGQTYFYTAFAYDGVPNYSGPAYAMSSNVWLNETFDNYGLGFLDGHGGWTLGSGKNSCVLQDSVRVGASGSGVEIFGSSVYDDATIANFGAITSGYHKISFDMRRNASAAANQAYIVMMNGANILTRVYWSTSFNMLTGPGITFTDLVTSPAGGQWYHVEIGLDMTSGTLDAWVDGVQKVFAKPFYNAATQIDSINITGYSAATSISYIENLRGEEVVTPPSAPTVTVPAIGSNVETQNPRINWTGAPHDAFELHVNTSNIATDGSSYDSGERVSADNFCDVGPLAVNQNYYVFVKLHNASGWGAWSAVGYWFRVIPNVAAPGAVSDFVARGSNNTAKLSWKNPSDTDFAGVMIRFRADKYPASESDGQLASTITGGTPGAAGSYTHSGLTNGVKYFYSAFAFDQGGLYSSGVSDFAVAEPWTVEYFADALPSSSSPAWTIFDAGNNESYSHIEPGGGILHVLDNSTISGSKIRWYRNWTASNSAGTTVLTRAKCESVTATEYNTNVTLSDGARYINFVIFPNKVASKAEATAVLDQQYALDGTVYHRYRFTLVGPTYACYVDEGQTPVFTGTAYTTTDNKVILGANGSSSMQSIYFDYLLYRTDGAKAPGVASKRILDAKLSSNTEPPVTLAGNVVSAPFTGYFYIQSPDGLHGLRVNRVFHGRSAGDVVDVVGSMSVNLDGERYISATTVSVNGSGTPHLKAINGASLGGADFEYNSFTGEGQRGEENGVGLNNVGLLVRAWGRVTGIDPSGAYFWIDDGSGPVKVLSEALAEPSGEPYVVVTGVSVLDASDGPIRAAIRPRTQADIVEF
ncbi:MAG: fibronectin type III domain-containing protein [Armatimonadota bacterium]|nr:fibronectin type III domain-containing protein [Armatimonadota bacterium]